MLLSTPFPPMYSICRQTLMKVIGPYALVITSLQVGLSVPIRISLFTTCGFQSKTLLELFRESVIFVGIHRSRTYCSGISELSNVSVMKANCAKWRLRVRGKIHCWIDSIVLLTESQILPLQASDLLISDWIRTPRWNDASAWYTHTQLAGWVLLS